MNKRKGRKPVSTIERSGSRVHCLKEISIKYEGQDEYTVVKPPDLSGNGMFITTGRVFPEGAVLHLQFRLDSTNALVQTRCEVRYCLPGVGIGVEFIGIAPAARREIERELASHGEGNARRTSRSRKARR